MTKTHHGIHANGNKTLYLISHAEKYIYSVFR